MLSTKKQIAFKENHEISFFIELQVKTKQIELALLLLFDDQLRNEIWIRGAKLLRLSISKVNSFYMLAIDGYLRYAIYSAYAVS